MKVERRIVAAPLEVRAQTPDEPTRLVGYAAVFEREAVIAGFFREQIAAGAFADAIQADDVRALFNHDPNFVLGRNTAGTLTLSEDETGLRYEVDPPDTQWARDLLVSVQRGDVTQSSFGFEVLEEKWTEPDPKSKALPLRTILKAKLWDVSPVTYPAYEETTAEARDHAASLATAAAVLEGATAADARMSATVLRQKRQAIIEGTL